MIDQTNRVQWKHGVYYSGIQEFEMFNDSAFLLMKKGDLLIYEHAAYFTVNGERIFMRVFTHVPTDEVLRTDERWLDSYLKG